MNIEIIKPHRDGKVWMRRGAILRDVAKLRGEELVRLGIARPAADVQTSALAGTDKQSTVVDQLHVQTSAQKLAGGSTKKTPVARGRAQAEHAGQDSNASLVISGDQAPGAALELQMQDKVGAESQAGSVELIVPAGAGDEPDQS